MCFNVCGPENTSTFRTGFFSPVFRATYLAVQCAATYDYRQGTCTLFGPVHAADHNPLFKLMIFLPTTNEWLDRTAPDETCSFLRGNYIFNEYSGYALPIQKHFPYRKHGNDEKILKDHLARGRRRLPIFCFLASLIGLPVQGLDSGAG